MGGPHGKLRGYLPGSALAATVFPFMLLEVLCVTLGLTIAGMYPLGTRTVTEWMPARSDPRAAWND